MLNILDYFNYIYKQERLKEKWDKSPDVHSISSQDLEKEKKEIETEVYDKNLLTSTLEGITKDVKIPENLPLKTKILHEIGVFVITFLILFINTFLYFGGGLIKDHINYSLLSTALILVFIKINKNNALIIGAKNLLN